jgi:hypothetical protein
VHELAPLEQHVLLGAAGENLRAHDGQAPLQREHGLDEGLLVAVHADAVRDLDDGIALRLGEVALAPLALDVEGEDAQRGHLGPLALGLAGDDLVVAHVGLDLGGRRMGKLASGMRHSQRTAHHLKA